MDPFLPDDDPDLALARRLHTDAAGAEARPDDAWLLTTLGAYRTGTEVSPDAGRSAHLWNGIAARTRPAARIHRLYAWQGWAAVAAVLVIGLALLAWLGREQDAPLFYAATPGGTPQHVTLPDGSEVTLRPGSSLRQVAHARYRIEGEAFFDVAHNPRRTFEVEAGAALVQVLGTRFDVQALGDHAEVFLASGKVRFSAGDSAVVLAPGQFSLLRGGVPVLPAAAHAEAALDWLDGRLIFRQQSLARIAREIEAHYGIQLEVSTLQQATTITGTLLLTGPEQALAQLGRVAGGHFEQIDARTYRLVVE